MILGHWLQGFIVIYFYDLIVKCLLFMLDQKVSYISWMKISSYISFIKVSIFNHQGFIVSK